MTLCALGVVKSSVPVMAADSIRELKNEVSKRAISPEDVNLGMRNTFPDSSFPYYEPANGCSNPLDFGDWNRVFENACNNHDICYTTPGNIKEHCDSQMLREMLRICATMPNSSCTTFAERYYFGIDEFGQSAYSAAQSQQSKYIENVYAWLNTQKANVFYTNSFVETSISVNPGDKIKVQATGTIRFGLFAGSGGPEGIIFNPDYNYFVNIPHGQLIGRIRQFEMQDFDGWFSIGEGREFVVRKSGILELAVNDNQPVDNAGEFRVEVTINSAKK
jgi:hypothetical protein